MGSAENELITRVGAGIPAGETEIGARGFGQFIR